MTTDDVDDAAFAELLRRVARTPDVSAVRRDVAPGTELIERFVVEQKLGEGAMGRVFAAFDRVRQTSVAIKMLGILTPRSIASMKREFRTAAELVHPNLVRLHELFSDGAEWFFTMDLLDGVTLGRLRGARRGMDLDVARSVFSQLAFALRELHDTGTLHGDLKPSNFLIVGPERRVVLLDFGLARQLGSNTDEHVFAGTPEYMAPEQAAGKPLTEAADWYSFGVVLFEALTGRLPSTSSLDADLAKVPAEHASLCRALLNPNPELRPHGEVVLRAIGGETRPHRVSSRPPRMRTELIGRGPQLARLREAFERVAQGRPEVVFVRGDSGIGKSALLEQFTRDVGGGGAIVLAGRCRERESVSYKAVDGLIEDLVRALDRLPAPAATALLPRDIADLTRLFPTLRAAAAISRSPHPSAEVADHGVVKRHAVAAFRELLAGLAERAPLVVWIDDLQWSDVHSAVLLEPLLSGSKPVPLLFVGSHRTIGGLRGATIEALYGSANARGLPEPTLIELGPLEPSDAESLARELLRPDETEPGVLARNIARDAGGHPLFIAELAHSHASPTAAPSTGAPQSLSALVQGRVRALPDDARELLEIAALAGTPLSHAAARRTQNLTPNQAERALDVLRVERLARTHRVADDAVIDVHHDRIREIVAQSVPAEVRRDHHRALARALETEPKISAEVLASHFQAAGELAEAGRHWIRAADVAFDALAFGYAAELYQRGSETALLEPRELAALQARQAEALAHAGQGAAAADVFLTAADGHAEGAAVELRRRAAEQLLLSGHLERGLEVIENVLRELGMRGTRTGKRVLFSILLGRIRVRLRGLRLATRRAEDIPPRELARLDASWSIACSLGVIDFMRGADFQNVHLLLALQAGEPRRLLRALTLEISYAATPGIGSQRRTQALLEMADELARKVDDPAAAGLVRVSRGVGAYLNGRFDEALTECREGVHVLSRCSGTMWETVTAQRFTIASLFHLGKLRTLGELVPPLLAEADTKGNLYASTFFRTSYSNSAWLLGDDVKTAQGELRRARAEWTAPGVQLAHCWMLVGDVNFAFYTGETAGLWEKLCEDWLRFEAAQFLRIGMLRVQLWHLRSWVALDRAHALSAAGSAAAGPFYDEARRAALRLKRERIALAAPLAEFLLSAVDYATGDPERALARLENAELLFERQAMTLYAVTAAARRGEIVGGSEGEALARAARARLAAEDVAAPERMLEVLGPAFARGAARLT